MLFCKPKFSGTLLCETTPAGVLRISSNRYDQRIFLGHRLSDFLFATAKDEYITAMIFLHTNLQYVAHITSMIFYKITKIYSTRALIGREECLHESM